VLDHRYKYWLILALFLAPYFVHLGTSALWDANEAFYVEGPREMLERGDLITPRFNFADRLQKPILSYWVVIAFFKLFGVSELSERLAIATCISLSIILTYLMGVRLYDRRTALLGAMALATSFKFIAIGRRSMIDALLTLALVAALYFFARGWQSTKRKRIYLLLFYAMMAVGVLTKGLLGVIIPGGVVGLFLAATAGTSVIRPSSLVTSSSPADNGPRTKDQGQRASVREFTRRTFDLLKQLQLLPGIALFLAIAVPWFAAMTYRHGGDYLISFFIGEHVSRYVYAVHALKRPLWYYIPTILGEFAPGSFFLPAAIVMAWRRIRVGNHNAAELPTRRQHTTGRENRDSHSASRHLTFDIRHPKSSAASDLFLFIWFIFILVFFSLSSAKQNEYVLQLYPAAALLVGRLFSDSESLKSKSVIGLLIAFTIALILILIFGGWLLVLAAGKLVGSKLLAYAPAIIMATAAMTLAWMLGSYLKADGRSAESAEESRSQKPEAGSQKNHLVSCILHLASAWRLLPLSGEKEVPGERNHQSLFMVTAIAALLLNFSFLMLLPEIETYRPVKPLAERITREADQGDLVGYYKFTAPSLCYYTRRKIFELFFPDEIAQKLRSDKRVFCLMTERDYRELTADPSLPLRALECRPSLFPMTMKKFLKLRSPDDLDRVCLATNR